MFSSSVYVMNVLPGPLLAVAVLFFVFPPLKEIDALKEISYAIPCFMVVFCAFIMGMAPSSSCAVSMEGKKMWILKTSPIETKKILFVKAYIYVLLCFPAVIISPIYGLIDLHFTILDAIFVFLSNFMLVSVFATISLWINTIRYKLNWNNASEAVKSSSSVLFAMLIDFVLQILLVVPAIIFYILQIDARIIIIVVSIIEFVFCNWLLFTHGVRKFEKIVV